MEAAILIVTWTFLRKITEIYGSLKTGTSSENACVQGSTNGTNGIPISFKVLPMVPLVIPLVPMVMKLVPLALPMLPYHW